MEGPQLERKTQRLVGYRWWRVPYPSQDPCNDMGSLSLFQGSWQTNSIGVAMSIRKQCISCQAIGVFEPTDDPDQFICPECGAVSTSHLKAPPLTEEEKLTLVEKWYVAKTKADEATNKENKLRILIAAECYPEKTEGTAYMDLPEHWRLKAEFKLYRNVDIAALPAVLEKMPEGSKENLLKFEPKLKITPYKQLPAEQKAIMDEAIIAKPGMPALTLVPPKNKKEDK